MTGTRERFDANPDQGKGVRCEPLEAREVAAVYAERDRLRQEVVNLHGTIQRQGDQINFSEPEPAAMKPNREKR